MSASRPVWSWLGQIAVVILGVHLAADHLDDWIGAGLVSVGLPFGEPTLPFEVAAWTAVAVEIGVVVWALWVLARTAGAEPATWRRWRATVSVDSFVWPAFWAPVALAGAWVVGMAVEDLAQPAGATLAAILGWTTAALCAWRLAWSGVRRVVAANATSRPRRWWLGLVPAPIVLTIAWIAATRGLPIWGWWP